MAESIHSPADWGAVRTKQPELFAKAMSEGGVDNSEHLLRAMDRHGVTHAIVQTAPGKGITNRMVLDAAEKSGRRFFPIYRPEAVSSAAAKGDLGTGSREDNARVVSQVADEFQRPAMRAMLGVGEITPISTEVHPALITRDMAPIMEVLKGRGGLPIMFPTGYSGWKGQHYYIYQPVWVDELAGTFPEVPIVLTKMGRSIRASFDALSNALRKSSPDALCARPPCFGRVMF